MDEKSTRPSIVRPSAVSVDMNSIFYRIPPRDKSQQQANYKEKFDFHTVFYDVFNSERGVELIGPPLLNLEDIFRKGRYEVDGSRAVNFEFKDLDRTQDSYICLPAPATSLLIKNDAVNKKVRVGEDFAEMFRGKYSLVTLSKNNPLTWIQDWARFYISNHGINSVLIYDNDSDAYTLEELADALSDIKGLEQVVIVSWPYKYGPQGGTWETQQETPWDSDFCQHGALNHARRRFLRDAAGVINADIDELVVLENGGSVFDRLAIAGTPVLSYAGMWIESIRQQTGLEPRFIDFKYLDTRNKACTRKWTASPAQMKEATQWKTHRIVGTESTDAVDVAHRHFKGMNSDWKYPRTTPVTFDGKYHVVDYALVNALEKSFTGLSMPTSALSSKEENSPLSPRLKAVKSELEADNRLPNFMTKIWFWKPNCLVLDFSVLGFRFGIDVVETETSLQMKVVGRNNDSKKVMAPSMGGKYQSLSSQEHWGVKSWRLDTDPLRIARDIASFVSKG